MDAFVECDIFLKVLLRTHIYDFTLYNVLYQYNALAIRDGRLTRAYQHTLFYNDPMHTIYLDLPLLYEIRAVGPIERWHKRLHFVHCTNGYWTLRPMFFHNRFTFGISNSWWWFRFTPNLYQALQLPSFTSPFVSYIVIYNAFEIITR